MFEFPFVLRILPVTRFAEWTVRFICICIVNCRVMVACVVFMITIAWVRLFGTMERILSIACGTELTGWTTFASGFHWNETLGSARAGRVASILLLFFWTGGVFGGAESAPSPLSLSKLRVEGILLSTRAGGLLSVVGAGDGTSTEEWEMDSMVENGSWERTRVRGVVAIIVEAH